MTTIFPQNNNFSGRKKKIFLGALIALFLAVFVFNSNLRMKTIERPINAVSSFLFKTKNSINAWWTNTSSFFANKNSLQNENARLVERDTELNAKFLQYESLKTENEELKALLGRINGKKYIIASIVSRPPQSPYDVLVIDAGSENGIKIGATTTAYGEILLGHIVEVSPRTSKIKLISFPGEKTNTIIKNINASSTSFSTEAVGLGGENLEIKLPNSIEISAGGLIESAGTFSLSVGIVEKVEVDLSNPFKKILFRLPVNLNELQSVLVEK